MLNRKNCLNWIVVASVAMGTLLPTTAPSFAKSKPTVCPIGTTYTPISKRCVPVAIQHGNLSKSSAAKAKKSRFQKFRVEKGRFGIIEMNGVRAKRTDIVVPNN